jgi:hypothetical protein
MPSIPLNDQNLDTIQCLIEANRECRDELYAAAELLDDEPGKNVCRRLAEYLAGHVVDLQQLVIACDTAPAEPQDVELLPNLLFHLAKDVQGESGVLDVAAEGARELVEDYDDALEEVSDSPTWSILLKQRARVDLSEHILHTMTGADRREADSLCGCD